MNSILAACRFLDLLREEELRKAIREAEFIAFMEMLDAIDKAKESA